MTLSDSYYQRFNGIARLYGKQNLMHFSTSHICVIGLGGVGSWAAESLARSGIGQLTLIDLDEVCISNTNRQLHTLQNTIGESKIEAMAARLIQINPEIKINLIDDFINLDNVAEYLGTKEDKKFNFIIDAIDSVRDKAAILAHCKRQKLKMISIGGAGGQKDPTQIKITDLAKTVQDPLLAKIRERLKSIHHLNKDSKGKYGIPVVFSTEQLVYPTENDGVCQTKKESKQNGRMDCQTGFGAISTVTATFGLVAVSYVLNYLSS